MLAGKAQREASGVTQGMQQHTVTFSASMAEAAASTFVRRPTVSMSPMVSFFAALMLKLENMKLCMYNLRWATTVGEALRLYTVSACEELGMSITRVGRL